jgi:hypothetical protein
MNFTEWVEQKKQIKTVYLVRSTSGGGKSYTARQILQNHGGGNEQDHIFTTDDFFIQDVLKERQALKAQGKPVDDDFYNELEKDIYRKNWRGDMLHRAHKWNFERFKQAVQQGVNPVIVPNTFVSAWELKPYVAEAEANGYKVIIQESSSPWWKDHAHMLDNKDNHKAEIEEFANFLAGYHQGMAKKYGVKGGNEHGVPLDTIKSQLRKWQPNLTADEVMGRNPHN